MVRGNVYPPMEASFPECNNIRGNKLFFAVTNILLIDNLMKNDFGWVMFLVIYPKSSWRGFIDHFKKADFG